jgi:hypothetical protein
LALGKEARTKGPGSAAWVDKEPSFQFEGLKAMCASPKEDINIHLARGNEQRIGVPRRDNGVAMGKSDPETPVRYHLGEREIRRVDIEIALDQLQVGCNLSQEFKGLAVREVA